MMVQDAMKLKFLTKFDAFLIRSYIFKEVFNKNLFQSKILNRTVSYIWMNRSYYKEYKV